MKHATTMNWESGFRLGRISELVSVLGQAAACLYVSAIFVDVGHGSE
jgi:hypothetical protein